MLLFLCSTTAGNMRPETTAAHLSVVGERGDRSRRVSSCIFDAQFLLSPGEQLQAYVEQQSAWVCCLAEMKQQFYRHCNVQAMVPPFGAALSFSSSDPPASCLQPPLSHSHTHTRAVRSRLRWPAFSHGFVTHCSLGMIDGVRRQGLCSDPPHVCTTSEPITHLAQ